MNTLRLLLSATLVVFATAVIPIRHPQMLKNDYENEILKPLPEEILQPEDEIPEPEIWIPDHDPEAYYYGVYGDLTDQDSEESRRDGYPMNTSSCDHVREVPAFLRDERYMRPNGIDNYYQKYTEAYGIPVLASAEISNRSLSRACYVLRFLLADRHDLRNAFYHNFGRITIIPQDGSVTDIPEYSSLPEVYDREARGLGAVKIAPVSSAGEENVLCSGDDPNRREDVLLRTIAHGINHLAAKYIIPNFRARLESMYDRAMRSGWWQNTYAAHTMDSYFGQAVQAFFNVNGYANPPNGVYNRINTRTKLLGYDPDIYYYILELFTCGNNYLKRCNSRGYESYQNLEMNCPGFGYLPPSAPRPNPPVVEQY